MKEITIPVPEGKKAEWINGVLTLVDEEKNDNRPVMERIKTLDDAINELGEDNPLVQAYKSADFNTSGNGKDVMDVMAYMKLRIIVAALNEGWEPQFTTDEYRYYPYFYLYTKEELAEKSDEWKESHKLWLCGGSSASGSRCGLACARSSDAWTDSASDLSARLALKSEELAIYCGKQFIEIWADYVGPFNR